MFTPTGRAIVLIVVIACEPGTKARLPPVRDAGLQGVRRVTSLDADELSGSPRSGAFLGDGGVAVVDYANQRVLVWDGAGRARPPVGRRGSGPGEFRQLVWLGSDHDTLLAFDFASRRFSLLDVEGRVPGTFRLPELDPGGWPAPVGSTGDGAVVFVGNSMPRPGNRSSGVVQDSSSIYVVDVPQERVTRRWGPVPTLRYRVAGSETRSAGMSVTLSIDPHTSIAVAGALIATATGTDSTVVLFDSTGSRTRVLHAPLRAEGLTSEDMASARGEDGTRDPAFRAARTEILAHFSPPDRSPVITDLVFATSDQLLVRGWASAATAVAPWVRMTTRDSVIGTFTLPRTARVLAARGDILLVTDEQEDGSVSLAIYDVSLVRSR